MAGCKPLSVTDAALRLLTRRDHTRRELFARLLSKGYQEAEVEETVERLAGWGYLDDYGLAVRAVEDCLERRPRGRALLAHELAARGVPDDALTQAFAAYPQSREVETAWAALARRGLRPPLGLPDRAKAMRILARLGFAEPIVERICGYCDP